MIGERLREERERLELTQPAFAEAAGAKKRTLIDWEKGVSSPTAVQLSALAEIGADVLYILTGQRSAHHIRPHPLPGVAEPTTNYVVLSRDEAALLDNYRHSPPEARRAIKETSAAFAKYSDCCGKGEKGGKSA